VQIRKDEPLAVLKRVFGQGGRYFLAVSALLGFELEGTGALLSEAELWSRAADNLGREDALDLGMPKRRGEVLVAGYCFAPGGTPVAATTAMFRVGGIEKKLVVIGDRYWLGPDTLRHTTPTPFIRMPLTWERAFGGPDYESNPCGRGIAARKLKDGNTVLPLPNLEDPQHPIAGPADRPPPAGCGPLGMSWPGRLRGLGTFDRRWLQEAWPGFPADFDFSYFNVAPPDQRREGFFHGDEDIATVHLTEGEGRLYSRLPGIRARLFLRRKGAEDGDWVETKANLDTVWLFPHAGMGVVIWHGVWETTDDEGGDVAEIMAVREPLGTTPGDGAGHALRLQSQGGEEPPPAMKITPAATPEAESGKEAVSPLSGGTGPVVAAAAAATPAVFAAPGAAAEAPERQVPPEQPPELAKYAPVTESPPPGATDAEIVAFYQAQVVREKERLNEYLRSLGLDPNVVTPPPELPPELAKYAPVTESPPSGATDTEIVAFYQALVTREEERLREYLRSLGVDPNAVPPIPEAPSPPPVAEIIAALAALPGDNRELIAALKEMESRQQALAEELAVLQGKAAEEAAAGEEPLPTPPPSGAVPDADGETKCREISERLSVGKDLRGMDLTGVDWGSFSLAGVDLSGANMEGAILAGHDLTGVNFSGALLSGSVLSGAVMAGAVMAGANAARAKLAGADLSGADLSGMDLSGADLTGADLTGADLTGADLLGANLSRVMGKNVRAANALFIGADLTAADFGRGVFQAADFSEAKMAGAILTEADLREAWFSDADAAGADLERTIMSGAKAEGRSSFLKARLAAADLGKTYFEDVDFSAADFTGADLTGASLTRCCLREACLSRSRAQEADFSKADLTGADLRGMNLMAGSLRKTNLKRADLRNANLFAVDFFQAILGETRFEGANLKRTLLSGEIVRP